MYETCSYYTLCPYVFIKRSKISFVIIAVYVHDLSIIATTNELKDAYGCLKREFEMKDLDKTKFCIGKQIKHLTNGKFIH